jgi:hypothetical protein
LEAVAGLAEVSQLMGEEAACVMYVEELLSHLQERMLEQTEESLWIYRVCHRILQEKSDPRADTIVRLAYAQLQSRAATLVSDEDRNLFWTASAHKFVVAAVHQLSIQ